jgi:hypothetical protein
MGGRTIIDFALEHPGGVRALLLVDSAVSGFEGGGDPPDQWDELVAADDAGNREQVSQLQVKVFPAVGSVDPDQVDRAVRDPVREMNLIALKNEAVGLGDERTPEPSTVNRLAEIQAPRCASWATGTTWR